MYFDSRAEAGRKLAVKLLPYAKQNCAVVALSEGAVIIGAQIAIKIHASLSLLLTEKVTLPGENDPLAMMSSSGVFTYNNMFSVGQLEEFVSEYHGFIEEERIKEFHQLNRLLGKGGEIDPELLKNHVVIVVSDGLKTGLSLDVAADFLKPIKTKRLIVATPIASVPAVDRMHLFADEICCLSTIENYMTTDHYYTDNNLPSFEELLKLIEDSSLIWFRAK